VELVNLRQFTGTQTIEFATDDKRKVTLIHGPNTVGKTTLLNAVFWCLYGDFLTGFDEPDRLLSQQSDGPTYGVELKFSHQGQEYIAKRSGSGRPGDAALSVLERRPTGHNKVHPQPDLLINSILPKPLASFFFFAGEYLKGLATGTYQKGATDAIRSVLGLKLAELAIEDLKELRKRKQRELQALSAGTDLADVSTALAEAQQFVETCSAQLIQQRALFAQLESEKRVIFEKLRGLESTTSIQSRRDKVSDQIRQIKRSSKAALLSRQQLISDYGATLFLSADAQAVTAFIDEAVTKKRIPSPFDKTFVMDILSSGTCVCARPVSPGTAEYRSIASLVNSATDEALIRRALAIRGVSSRVSSGAANAPRAFKNALQQVEDTQSQLEGLEQEAARISDLLKRHEQTNVREMEAQLERLEEVLRELISNKQRSETSIEAKKSDVERLKKELDRAQAASPQVDQARTALDFVELLIASLEKELVIVEKQGLTRITEALNDVVGKSTRQKYAAEVTSDYSIKLFKEDAGGKTLVRTLSSGERRLLDLCFVSSLVSVCRQREHEKNAIVLPGAVAPMMVDAPFGELDPEYQALAAKTMMDLSEQLILMLSKTHWTPEVDAIIRPSISQEYLLLGHKKDPPLDAGAVNITIAGREYQQMFYNAQKDWTEVKAIGSKR
jgi:DNA sulfur modification protein DndD